MLAGDLEVTLSMGRTGQCWDNALAESFFASLRGECLDQQLWPTRAAARATIEYIGWYNGTRLHSALGYQTPNEFEATTDGEALTRAAWRANSPVRQSGATPVQLKAACDPPTRDRWTPVPQVRGGRPRQGKGPDHRPGPLAEVGRLELWPAS